MSLETKLRDILMSFPVFSRSKQRQWAGEEEFVHLQIGGTCHYIQRSMRSELWLSFLLKHRLNNGAEMYLTMLAKGQQLPEEVAFDIEKDVNRTFPEVAKFAKGKGVQSLMNVLKAYAATDTEVGYCQGINFLVGLLLMYLPKEEDAYSAMLLLMQHRHLRELYKTDLASLQVKLWQVGRLMPPLLAAHLERHSCLPVLYMSAWFLTGYASSFPLPFASRVMDVLLTDSHRDPVMKVALSIMKACAPRLMEMNEMEDLIEFLKDEVPLMDPEKLQEILTDALSSAWSAAEIAILEDTAGSMTVLDAVKANEADVLSGAAATRASARISAAAEETTWGAASALAAQVPSGNTLLLPLPRRVSMDSAPQLYGGVVPVGKLQRMLQRQNPLSFGSTANAQMAKSWNSESKEAALSSHSTSSTGGKGALSGLLPPPPRSSRYNGTAQGWPHDAASSHHQQQQQEQLQQQASGRQGGHVSEGIREDTSTSESSWELQSRALQPSGDCNDKVGDSDGDITHLHGARPGVVLPLRRTATNRPVDLLSGSQTASWDILCRDRRASDGMPPRYAHADVSHAVLKDTSSRGRGSPEAASSCQWTDFAVASSVATPAVLNPLDASGSRNSVVTAKVPEADPIGNGNDDGRRDTRGCLRAPREGLTVKAASATASCAMTSLEFTALLTGGAGGTLAMPAVDTTDSDNSGSDGISSLCSVGACNMLATPGLCRCVTVGKSSSVPMLLSRSVRLPRARPLDPAAFGGEQESSDNQPASLSLPPRIASLSFPTKAALRSLPPQATFRSPSQGADAAAGPVTDAPRGSPDVCRDVDTSATACRKSATERMAQRLAALQGLGSPLIKSSPKKPNAGLW